MRRSVLLATLAIAFAAAAQRHRAVRPPVPPAAPQPQRVVLTPSKDATLYESGNGSLANGAGPHLFAGTTSGRQIRRTLVAFDVAANVPAGSQITGVTLTFQVSRSVSNNETMSLRAVTTNWGEGPSNAGDARDGIGVAAQAGDATWIHSSSPNQRWSKAGGDFATSTDATALAPNIGAVSFGPSAAMIERVQSWLNSPATNFGWIILGNENAAATAKRLDSREVPTESTRPTLTIDYLPAR